MLLPSLFPLVFLAHTIDGWRLPLGRRQFFRRADEVTTKGNEEWQMNRILSLFYLISRRPELCKTWSMQKLRVFFLVWWCFAHYVEGKPFLIPTCVRHTSLLQELGHHRSNSTHQMTGSCEKSRKVTILIHLVRLSEWDAEFYEFSYYQT